jgi:hypothetical protein
LMEVPINTTQYGYIGLHRKDGRDPDIQKLSDHLIRLTKGVMEISDAVNYYNNEVPKLEFRIQQLEAQVANLEGRVGR